jgi:hypothetical protein
MVKKILLGILLLSVIALGCGKSKGPNATINYAEIYQGVFYNSSSFVVPVSITLSKVPKSPISYTVQLTSSDGYVFNEYVEGGPSYATASWEGGDNETTKVVRFCIPSYEDSSSQVYLRLIVALRDKNLESTVNKLLDVQVTKN